MYFCLAWQNRRGLWAAMKVSSEVNGVWGGRILNVTTLLEVECFQSGETQVVRGIKLFLSPPCAMNKLWSYPQSNWSNGETMKKSKAWRSFHPSKFFFIRNAYGNFCARVSWDPGLLATTVPAQSSQAKENLKISDVKSSNNLYRKMLGDFFSDHNHWMTDRYA